MNASQTQSFKIPVLQKHVWFVALATLCFINLLAFFSEMNHMFWPSLIGTGVAFLVVGVYEEEDGRVPFFTRKNWDGLSVMSAALLLVVGAPLLHFADQGKVWIVDGKTSLDNAVLIRSPFTPFATSIDKKQDISIMFTAVTKEGISVVGTVAGAFRLTDNESEIVSHIGARKNPDLEIRRELVGILSRAFGDALARRNVADISALANNFALEVDVATAAAVKQLGLRRNGSIIVYNLHPYLVEQ